MLKTVVSAVLYAAVALGANPVVGMELDMELIDSLRVDDMRKLTFHAEPRAPVTTPFLDREGAERTLADYEGKVVLLNFWATWCAPCRKEMPALDRLQQAMGGDRFEVVTIATGRNPLPSIDRFFDKEGVTALPILLDPKQQMARDMAVLGLPITVVLDPQGQEIARLRGDAHWDAPQAMAVMRAVIDGLTEVSEDSES